MNKYQLFYLFLLIAASFFTMSANGQRVHFKLVPMPRQEPAFNVNSMAQDKQGFMWLATSAALYKYDGFRFKAYHNEPLKTNSLGGAELQTVVVDEQGYVWTTPRNTGLDRLDPATGVFTHFRHNKKDERSLGCDSIWCSMIDHTGTLWLGTSAGIDVMDRKKNTFTHFRNNPFDSASISNNTIRIIYEDKAGTIWVGTGSTFFAGLTDASGGLNRFDRKTGKFTRWVHSETDKNSLVDSRVTALLEDSRGNFWVGTANAGLHILDRKTGFVYRYSPDSTHAGRPGPPAFKNDLSFVVDHVTFIEEDAAGRIWIGSVENGINVYDPHTRITVHYGGDDKENGALPDKTFWKAFKTRDNELWLGTWTNNFYKVSPGNNQLPYYHTGKTVICAAESNDHTLWLTTFKGLIHKNADGTEETFYTGKQPADSSNPMYFIEKDGDQFWITSASGLFRFDATKKIFHPYPSDGPKRWVADSSGMLKKDTGNILWISTGHGLDKLDVVTGFVNNYSSRSEDSTTISNNLVISMSTDHRHRLWVCTDKGVNRLVKASGIFKRYLAAIAVIHVYEDHTGVIWAGTSDGLYRYDSTADSFSRFTDQSGMPSAQVIFWTQDDNLNNLWLTANTMGIIKFGADRLLATTYGINQGVNCFALTGYIFLRNNGHLIIPDTAGYYDIDPMQLPGPSSPNVDISHFLLNNNPVLPSAGGILQEPLEETKEIKLAHDQNTFSFRFSNVDFSSEKDDARLLYRLENYEAAWRVAGDSREAYYFNLSPGKYVFRVKAINAGGGTAEKQIVLVISPPWWKSWWAIGLFITVIGGCTFLLYWVRIKRMQQMQSRQMGIIVAAQEDERKRISRDLHDDVGTKLSALKLFLSSLQEKSAITGNAEAGSLAHTAGQFITEVIQDVRNLLQNLSPAILEEFGYVTAVEGLVEKINQTRQLHFVLTTFGIRDRLQKDYELALFRITQELISNVLKHAQANNVSLQIGYRDAKLILMLEDDGRGFDMALQTSGLGLHNLKTRTKLMNGTMLLDAQPGRGTTVLIEIPYQQLP